MNIVILHDHVPPDAPPDEQDNLVQAKAVEAALVSHDHTVQLRAFGLNLGDLTSFLEQARPDMVFNLVESVNGIGRLSHISPAILESLNIAYTGCGVAPLFVTGSKLRTKDLLSLAHIPTPRWFTEDSLAKGTSDISGQYILKPVFEHGSVGLDDWSVIKVASRNQLQEKLLDRHSNTGNLYFAETYTAGREFNLSLLERPEGPVILPPAEILFENWDSNTPKIVGYAAKWDEQSQEYWKTPRKFDFPLADQGLLRHLRHLALACWTLFEMAGYARVDFRVSEFGEPYVIDINPNPCLAPDSGLAAAAQCAGLDYAALVEAIVLAADK
ncbi:MAG: D-alanine--D-alanine ligase [Proteobacteria bacterium]|nr:D-alanine--D-alanine ligase [Pseudomonadota bacterium]MBU1611727.1 D-alanine--D-alanine ligase [Pseudomonadota bacterium]